MTSLLLLISLLAQTNLFGCGETVKISATPKEGYRFVEWSDGITQAEREVELSSDSTLTARFEKQTATSIEFVPSEEENSASKVRKVLINDHIFIIRDEKIYTIQGELVR